MAKRSGDGDLAWDAVELTSSEVRWLGVLLMRLRARRGMTMGTFAEAIVALELPGAVHSPGGTDRWDLTWRGIKIEVKASRNNRWKVEPAWGPDGQGGRTRRLWADVWVIAVHTGADHREGWSFYVVPRARVDSLRQKEFGLKVLRSWGIEPVALAGLPKAIRAAHRAAPKQPA